jgi:hypothetical protein
MLKAIRRIFGIFAFFAVIFGALKSIFDWISRTEDDNHEVFTDEEEREDVW